MESRGALSYLLYICIMCHLMNKYVSKPVIKFKYWALSHGRDTIQRALRPKLILVELLGHTRLAMCNIGYDPWLLRCSVCYYLYLYPLAPTPDENCLYLIVIGWLWKFCCLTCDPLLKLPVNLWVVLWCIRLLGWGAICNSYVVLPGVAGPETTCAWAWAARRLWLDLGNRSRSFYVYGEFFEANAAPG